MQSTRRGWGGREWRRHVLLAVCLLGTAGLPAGCGLESPILQTFNEDHLPPPEVADNRVVGTVTGLAGARVTLVTAPGQAVGQPVTVEEDGDFAFPVPGTSEYRSLRVVARRGEKALLGLVPLVPRARRAGAEGIEVRALEEVSPRSTAHTLALMEAARRAGASLAAATEANLRAAIANLDRSPALPAILERVEAWLAAASASGTGPSMLGEDLFPDPAFLAGLGVDAVGEAAEVLEEAARASQLRFCYAADRIRLVLTADMNPGTRDGNCVPIDRFRWAKDSPGKRMFVTGAVHDDQVDIPPAQREAVNILFGNWKPNVVPMYDDGTHGDAVAGDGIWTFVADLPRLAEPLKLGYKYTWGTPGAGWTATEEWPGNRRILEVVDLNGDGLVVRHDNFGDETTNKDRLNARRGGRGMVTWTTDADGDCIPDARERPVDTDGDCVADAWPAPAAASPIVGDGDRCAPEPDVEACWDVP